MPEYRGNKVEMKSGQLNEGQKGLVMLMLFTGLRQAVVKMNETSGPATVVEFQKSLIESAKTQNISGMPLEQEKAAVDFAIDLFKGLVTVVDK